MTLMVSSPMHGDPYRAALENYVNDETDKAALKHDGKPTLSNLKRCSVREVT
jgi:hypothetical protein